MHERTCPLASWIFTNTTSPHFVYMDEDKQEGEGAVVVEMKTPIQTNQISDYLHDQVVNKAVVLMSNNLNIYTELEENCSCAVWKNELRNLK